MLSPAVVIDANFKAPTLWGATTTAFIGAEDVILCLGGVIVTFFKTVVEGHKKSLPKVCPARKSSKYCH